MTELDRILEAMSPESKFADSREGEFGSLESVLTDVGLLTRPRKWSDIKREMEDNNRDNPFSEENVSLEIDSIIKERLAKQEKEYKLSEEERFDSEPPDADYYTEMQWAKERELEKKKSYVDGWNDAVAFLESQKK